MYGNNLPDKVRINRMLDNVLSGVFERELQYIIFEDKKISTFLTDEILLSREKAYEIISVDKYFDFLILFEQKMDKELKKYMGFKNTEDMPFETKIAVYLVHGLKNKIKEKLPESLTFKKNYYIRREQLERSLEELLADNKFIYLDGLPNSGKTILILNYSREHALPVIYCSQASSLTEMLEQVEFEEDEYLKGELWQYCWWNKLEALDERIEARIGLLEMPFLLVAGSFVGNKNDIADIYEFAWKTGIYIIIEKIHFPKPELLEKKRYACLEIESLTKEQLIDIFWKMQKKYSIKYEREHSMDDILYKIQDSIFSNPQLMILIAENYWYIRKKESIEQASKFLTDVWLLLLGRKGKGKFKEIKSITNQHQLNILGHIRKLFGRSVGNIGKCAFYVLSLLSGLKIEKRLLSEWFEIDNEALEMLEETGWCGLE